MNYFTRKYFQLPEDCDEDEDLSVYNYNGNPYTICVNGKTFKLIVDCDAPNSCYLRNLSEGDAEIADCVYDQVTAACENLLLELNGFDGEAFNTKETCGDVDDKAEVIADLKDELYRSAGIAMEWV